MAEFFRGGTPVHGNAVAIQSPQQMGPAQAMYLPQGLGNAFAGFGGAQGGMMPGAFNGGQTDEGLAALMKMYGMR